MTKNMMRKAAFVFTKEERGPGETETVQLAVPIPRSTSRWLRHYALDQGLSMAELIRRILRDFMAYREPDHQRVTNGPGLDWSYYRLGMAVYFVYVNGQYVVSQIMLLKKLM